MPPRKSLPRSAAPRSELAAASSSSKRREPIPEASGSGSFKSLPPVSIPESITPAFKRQKLEPRVLDDDERAVLVHELVGFYPRQLCDRVLEIARQNVYDTVGLVDAWGHNKAGALGDEYRMEVDIGLHSLETLLESQVDKAIDKFTAWALRNPFEAPSDVELVLPWHKDLDFERGQHVAALDDGERSVMSDLDKMRLKVEQIRYTDQQLITAEKLLDQRLEVARQRKSDIAFVSDTLASANLLPLAPKSEAYRNSLTTLQTLLSTMEDPHPSIPPSSAKGAPGENIKAWEMGRQAYLSWAVGRAVGQHQALEGAGGVAVAVDEMGEVEREAEGAGGIEGVEGLLKAVGR